MSADNDTKDHSRGAEPQLSHTPITTASPGLELPPLRKPSQQEVILPLRNMPAMAVRQPPLPSMVQHMAYEDQRQFHLTRPRTEVEAVELPSIRQAVPEIQTRGSRSDAHYRTDSPRQPSPFSSRVPGSISEYNRVSEPSHKRQRSSTDDGYESDPRNPMAERRSRSPARQGQRTYRSTVSPTSSARRTSIPSITDSRNGSNRTSPYVQARVLPPIRSPPLDSTAMPQRQEWRPTLPSLPALTFDCGPASLPQRTSNFGEYSYDNSRSGAQTYPQLSNGYEPPTSQLPPGFANSYHPRGQSYSGPSGRERTPFSTNHHQYSSSSTFPYGMELPESGNEGKQRKRRGNLPKETTDKLRAWFVGHIQHPYPTEDEKQDLMRQTGLQMNQISNWFINARRRQLPTMMNNARAELDARSARGAEVATPANSVADYAGLREQRSSGTSGDSDDGGSGYEEEFADENRQRGPGR